ncbi:MAG: hypothetical protein HQL50_02630 [Magnetococcales bacterium]|nr:hypothetical protein [Magnetococcales bacterium]
MTTLGAILLARMDSSRLPGKQLKRVGSKRVMDFIVERVRAIRGLDCAILATSDRSCDDPLVKYADAHGISCYRGDAVDVAGRVAGAIQHFNLTAWARINCDSPLIDHTLYSEAIDIFRTGHYEIVTNGLMRTYPIGNTVEIFSSELFLDGYAEMREVDHHEHVTLYFYQHAERYTIYSMQATDPTLRRHSLAIDTPEDLERFRWMVEQMDGSHVNYGRTDLLQLLDRCPIKTVSH